MLFYYPHSSEYAILAMIILLAMFKPNFTSAVFMAILSFVIVFLISKNSLIASCVCVFIYTLIRPKKVKFKPKEMQEPKPKSEKELLSEYKKSIIADLFKSRKFS